jgi:predicted dehydrogenase
LAETKPDASSVSTYPNTHAAYIRSALNKNARVFAEKPLALTTEDAQSLVDLALKNGKKMAVGYILRVHPAWSKFVEVART